VSVCVSVCVCLCLPFFIFTYELGLGVSSLEFVEKPKSKVENAQTTDVRLQLVDAFGQRVTTMEGTQVLASIQPLSTGISNTYLFTYFLYYFHTYTGFQRLSKADCGHYVDLWLIQQQLILLVSRRGWYLG